VFYAPHRKWGISFCNYIFNNFQQGVAIVVQQGKQRKKEERKKKKEKRSA
jgi:hypothetical protein